MTFQPRLIITSGEPAGIGPDLCVQLAQQKLNAKLIVLCDPELLKQRAHLLQLPVNVHILDSLECDIPEHKPGTIHVYPVPLSEPVIAGELNANNSAYVVRMLDIATQACLSGIAHAVVTGPVHKGIINDAGVVFTGHTEYLAELTKSPLPVMMLQTEGLRVALATTHVPLRDVANVITRQRLTSVINILHADLVSKFGITNPVIMVCGLNPHAGEGGHLGDEEQHIISPALEELRNQGMNLVGPLSADTIFSPDNLQQADVFLAMYHDQGLPVLKYKGFGQAINITLGLPIIRTSVDHGTALELAGSGKADSRSFLLAIESARQLAMQQH